MSSYGVFEADEAAANEPRRQARTAARHLDAAINEVRKGFGRFLMGATGIDEFEDRWHLSKADIRSTVEPHVFPNTGTMRRIQNAMKADWKVAHPYKLAEDRDAPIQDIDETFSPSSGNLIPDGNFQAYEDSVDQGGPEKVQNAFTPGDRSARRRTANPTRGFADHLRGLGIDPHSIDDQEELNDHLADYINGRPDISDEAALDHYDQIAERLSTHGFDDDLPIGPGPEETYGHGDVRNARRVQADGLHSIDDIYDRGGSDEGFVNVSPLDGIYRNHPGPLDGEGGYDPTEDPNFIPADYLGPAPYAGGEPGLHRHEAAKLVADIYTDFARSNGMRVASLDTLDRYASTGIHDADYELLQNLIVAACECDDEDDKKEAPKAPESDSDDDSDDDSDAPDFGGEGDSEGPDEGSDDDDDSDEDDSDSDGGGEAPDFGGSDESGSDDFGGDTGGGQQFTVPEQAPELEPQLLDEIPHENPQGAAPIPPEVIDSLLGLPEGTIEQLLLEEVQKGQGGGDGFGGPPQGGPPPAGPEQAGPPQGGGDDFFGGGGGEPEPPQDPRVARSRQATPKGLKDKTNEYGTRKSPASNKVPGGYDREPVDSADAMDMDRERQIEDGNRQRDAARRFWAAEDDSESSSDSGGGAPAGPPAQDPAAAGGAPPMDPNAMAQPMLPPPGSQSVAPPPPAAPTENQPAEDQLLDTANQAIMQMIDQQTQQYQQIIDPLSQALQAIQFAQQVEGQEHPLNVTPPQGTVDVAPSAAPGGAADPNPLQPTASRRQVGYNDFVSQPWEDSWDHMEPSIKVEPGTSPEEALARAREHRRTKKDAILRNAARVIATKHRLSATGERMLLEAMGRRQYEHVREALALVPPEVRQPAAIHMGEMFAADNPRFNKNAWMKTVMASTSRGRLPFDRPRTAGETWTPTATEDAFEFPNAGKTPRVDDGITVNNLPKMKGADPNAKVASDIAKKLQNWMAQQQARGLNYGGDVAAEGFLSQHPKAGPRATQIVHQTVGAEPHPPAETPAPKVGPPTAAKTAGFFTRKVAGWKWDDHLSGYLSKEARAFTCSCGEKVAAPSYKTCKCGTTWNVYALGDTHHLASDTADMFIAREIKPGVGMILAGKNMEHGIPSEDGNMASGSGSGRVRGVQPRTGSQRGSNGSASSFWSTDSSGSDAQGEHSGQSSRLSHRSPGAEQYQDGSHADGSGLLRTARGSAGSSPERRSARQSSGEPGLRDGRGQHGGHGSSRDAVAAAENALPRRASSGGTQSGSQPGASRTPAVSGVPAGAQLGAESPRGRVAGGSGSVLPEALGRVAQKSQRELLAEIDRLADWTKYDDDDDTNVSPKTPSTKITNPPKDWARRDSNGTWQGPAIPHRKK